MRGLILAWLLVAVSMAACVSYHERTKWVPELTPFEQVCKALKAACVQDGILPPIVVISEVVDPFNVHGLYIHGEPYIFINSATDLPYDTIIIHETVHYVIVEAGLVFTYCGSERAARKITLALTGEKPGDWEVNYGCVGKI